MFIGFGKCTFKMFVKNHLAYVFDVSSQQGCFEQFYDYEPNKSNLNNQINGNKPFSQEDQNILVNRGYEILLEAVKKKKMMANEVLFQIDRLAEEFEQGSDETEEFLEERKRFEEMTLIFKKLRYVARISENKDEELPKRLYAYALYGALVFFVKRGQELPPIQEEIKALMQESAFCQCLHTILSASRPDKRGLNTKNKSVELTRYALYSLVRYQYPAEAEMLMLLGDETKTAEELNAALPAVSVSHFELDTLKAELMFQQQKTEQGKATKRVIVASKETAAGSVEEPYLKNALDFLLRAYQNLPQEFHEHVRSNAKIELNFTVSQMVRAVAEKGFYSRSEAARSELLALCDCLIRTHNHHNDYIFALVEKTRDGKAWLFKKYCAEDAECKRALQIIKNFYEDVWETDQSPIIFGDKLLEWCHKDTAVVYDLINEGHCFDAKLWNYFRAMKGERALKWLVCQRVFKERSGREDAWKNIFSFFQMIRSDNCAYLYRPSEEEEYNHELSAFLHFILQRLPTLRNPTVKYGMRLILKEWPMDFCEGFKDIPWEDSCYSDIRKTTLVVDAPMHEAAMREAVIEIAKQETPTPQDLKRAAEYLHRLVLKNQFFDALKWATVKLLHCYLKEPQQYYKTILVLGRRAYAFANCHELMDECNAFAREYLMSCDYTRQERQDVNHALNYLKHSGYHQAETALFTCFAEMGKIKKRNTPRILAFLIEGLGINRMVEALCGETEKEERPYSRALATVLTDRERRFRIQESERDADLLVLFIDRLLEERERLPKEVRNSVEHFAKREELFEGKAPTSDEFYKNLLLESDCQERVDSFLVKQKIKGTGLAFETAVFHLCKVLKEKPEATAILCMECIAKYCGQLRYFYKTNSRMELKDLYIFAKRTRLIPILFGNPSIRNTVKLYCTRMMDYGRVLPKELCRMVAEVVRADQYPQWYCDAVPLKTDRIREKAVSLSLLKTTEAIQQTAFSDEIQNKLMPWLREGLHSEVKGAYLPEELIFAVKQGDFYRVLDGNRAINQYKSEARAYGDFDIYIQVAEMK